MPKRKRVTYGMSARYNNAQFKAPRRTGTVTTVRIPAIRAGYGSVARARGAAVTGEMKYFDVELQTYAIPAVTSTWVAGTLADPTTTINLGDAAVATPLCLYAPKVSAALNGRIGRKIKVLKIKLNGTIFVATQGGVSTADAACKVRLMMVLDKQANATAMTGAQLMNDATSAATTIHSFQNPNNFGRFRVLKEKVFHIDDLNLTGSPTAVDVIQSGRMIPFKINYTFKKPLLVNFNATNGGTVADIIDNAVHIIAGTSNAAFVPSMQYYARTCYKE